MADINLSGFEELQHTADWALHVWAQDIKGLFEQSALGMYALMEIKADKDTFVERELSLHGGDMEDWLVSFLSELLLGEMEGLAFNQFELQVEPGVFNARMSGGKLLGIRKEIKAVTYHNLAVRQVDGHWEVTIVFDV
jgi:SHS2 domain-containing protein